MIPLFTALASESTAARLRVSIFYTRAPTKSFDGMYLPPGITLAPGRPKFLKHLDALVSSTLNGGGCSGVFVGVCGPTSLASSVSEIVRCFDPNLKRSVGGVEFHEEYVRLSTPQVISVADPRPYQSIRMVKHNDRRVAFSLGLYIA